MIVQGCVSRNSQAVALSRCYSAFSRNAPLSGVVMPIHLPETGGHAWNEELF